MATQFLLNPTHGKSAEFLSVESTSMRKMKYEPLGSLVWDTPTSMEELALLSSDNTTMIQRLLMGSYSILGSKKPLPPEALQKASIDTVLSVAPVALSWMR
jgi:hypothetical protein